MLNYDDEGAMNTWAGRNLHIHLYTYISVVPSSGRQYFLVHDNMSVTVYDYNLVSSCNTNMQDFEDVSL